MRPEDIERVRRSLAMSPSLPGAIAEELLAALIEARGEVERIRADLRQLLETLEDHGA